MKTLMLLLSLTVATVTNSFAAFDAGRWVSLTFKNDQLIAAGNFTVAETGKITGKALYLNGEITTLSGKAKEAGTFTLTQRAETPALNISVTGKFKQTGDSFTAKVTGTDIKIVGTKVPNDLTQLGVYLGQNSLGDGVAVIVKPDLSAVSFLAKGTTFKFQVGKVEGKVFSAAGDGVTIHGLISGSNLSGGGKKGKKEFTFAAKRL